MRDRHDGIRFVFFTVFKWSRFCFSLASLVGFVIILQFGIVSTSLASELPAGWKAWTAPDGRTYYERPDGTTTWDRPPTPTPTPEPTTTTGIERVEDTALPDGWKQWRTAEGKVYYERPDGTTTWDRPPPGTKTEQPPPPSGTMYFTRYHSQPIAWADKFIFGGSLEQRFSGFFKDDPDSDERVWNDTIFNLLADIQWNQYVRTYGQMELKAYWPQSDQRIRVYPEEAYLDIAVAPVTLRGGWQIYSWGTADLYNPTDLLTPRDYTDILNADKDGILSFNVQFNLGNWTLTGLWVPLPDESELPKPGYRFFEIPEELEGISEDIISDIAMLEPSLSLKNGQAGARLDGVLGEVDVSLSYLYRLATVPEREIVVSPFDPVTNTVTVSITEVFPREHVIGADLETLLGELSVHLETATSIPEDTGREIDSADQLRFHYVAGGHYIFDDFAGDDRFSIFLDFSHIIHQGKKSVTLERIFQLSLLAHLLYEFSEDVRMMLFGSYNFDDEGYLIRPKLEWDFYKGFSLALGADIIGGPEGSFFNQFNEDDRGYGWFTYEF